jgi:hypothetical protein
MRWAWLLVALLAVLAGLFVLMADREDMNA